MNKVLNYIFEQEKSPEDTKRRYFLYFLLCYLIWLVDALTTIVGVKLLGAVEVTPIMSYLQNLGGYGWLLTYVVAFVGVCLCFLSGYAVQRAIIPKKGRIILLQGKLFLVFFFVREIYVLINNFGVIFSLL